MTVLPACVLFDHDLDGKAKLAFHDLGAFVLACLDLAAGAVVGRNLWGWVSLVLLGARWRSCTGYRPVEAAALELIWVLTHAVYTHGRDGLLCRAGDTGRWRFGKRA